MTSTSATSKRVLLTGASGFIGSHCVAPLVARGYDVIGVYSKREPEPQAGVTWMQADLLDTSKTAALVERFKPSHLLHCAWFVDPGTVINDVLNLYWVQASIELLRRFRDSGGVRCVVSGSCYEYDWRYGYCVEDLTPKATNTFYGRAKVSLHEAFCGYCAVTGLSGAWGRIFFLYGPRENPRRLVSSIALSLLRGEPASTSHGKQIRDYIHVQDVADALVAMLDSQVTGAYNIGCGQPITLRTIIDRLGDIAGKKELLHIGAIPARANDTPLVVADVTKIGQDLGWSPRIGLDEGLAATLEWWRQNMRANK